MNARSPGLPFRNMRVYKTGPKLLPSGCLTPTFREQGTPLQTCLRFLAARLFRAQDICMPSLTLTHRCLPA